MIRIQGRLVDNLPKIYGIYTGGFILFILLMSILSKLGASAQTIGILFVAFTICIYAIIGWLSRTMQLDAYYVAGREVPAVYNGMATAADWMSGASFVALAGGMYFGGYVYMAFVVGWTGGYVLVNALMAPYLRKFGCYTVPDFIGTRYGGNFARLCAVIILVVASFTYVTAQINASGTIAARALQIPFSLGIWVGLVAILMCSMLGGMRAVTWTQVAQYIVLIIAYLTPVIWMSNSRVSASSRTSTTAAPSTVFRNCSRCAARDQANGEFQGPQHPYDADQRDRCAVGELEVLHARAVHDDGHGILAAHPDALLHHAVRAGGAQVGGMVAVLHLPAVLHRAVPGDADQAAAARSESVNLHHRQAVCRRWPTWRGSRTGRPLGCCIVSDSNHDGILQLNEFFMRPDIVVLATPEMAGLPYVISGLVAAGGLAAAMSTADGLLLAIANALSHDLYYKMIDPNADTRLRLIVARILLVIIGVAACAIASLQLTGILGAVAWAF